MRKDEADQKAKIEEIKQRASQRPYVFEGAAANKGRSNLAKLQATKKVLDAYNESGLSQDYAMRTLTQEQKELIQQDGYSFK